MRYDCKVQCPKCSNDFKIEMDTTSSAIVNHSYPTKCPNCTKMIMVKVGDANRFCDFPESKVHRLKMGKRLTSLPGPYQPTGSAKDKDDPAFQMQPHPYKHKPAQTNRSFTFDKPTRARNGLKVAFILLIIVFIRGAVGFEPYVGVPGLTIGCWFYPEDDANWYSLITKWGAAGQRS